MRKLPDCLKRLRKATRAEFTLPKQADDRIERMAEARETELLRKGVSEDRVEKLAAAEVISELLATTRADLAKANEAIRAFQPSIKMQAATPARAISSEAQPIEAGTPELPGLNLNAAAPQENEESEPPPIGTAIKNAQADVERVEHKLPEAKQKPPLTDEEILEKTMAYIAKNPQSVDILIHRLKSDTNAVPTDREVVMLNARKVTLENNYDKAVADLNRAYESNDLNAQTEALARKDAINDQFEDVLDVAKRMGTEQGRAFGRRKMFLDREYKLVRMEAEMRAAKGGQPLSSSDYKELQELAARIKADNEKFSARVEELEKRESDRALKDAMPELEKEAKEEFSPMIIAAAKKVAGWIKAESAKAKSKLSDIFKKPSGGIKMQAAPPGLDPNVFQLISTVAAEANSDGLTQEEWKQQMRSEYGEGVEPYLESAWEQAGERVDEIITKYAPTAKPDVVAKVKAKTRKQTPEKDREKTVKRIKDRIQSSVDENAEDADTDDFAAEGLRPEDFRIQIRKLALSFVRSGVNDRHSLVESVRKELSDIFPDITERETMDLISGYGHFTELDKEEAKVRLRELSGELQQMAKLEDLMNRVPLEKTGLERRTQSDEERRLIHQVNEAKKKYGVVVTDPTSQLKGALDAIKNRLRHQIQDLTNQMETNQKPEARTPIEKDEEAERLEATRDRIRKTLHDIQGSPEMTDEERSKVAMRAVEKNIKELQRKIDEKDFGPQEKAKGFSPTAALEALKARRDALDAELENLKGADAAYQEQLEFDRIMKQADTIAGKLEAGDVEVKKAGKKGKDTDLIASARAHLESLQEQLRSARAASPLTRAARIEGALSALDQSIAEYDRRLATGDITPIKRGEPITSPEIEARRSERDAMKTLLTEIRNASKAPVDHEANAIKSYNARLRKEHAKLMERMAAGDFEKHERKKLDISRDPETVALKAISDKGKKEFERRRLLEERKRRTGMQKAIAVVKESLNLPRAVMASFDLSGVLRREAF